MLAAAPATETDHWGLSLDLIALLLAGLTGGGTLVMGATRDVVCALTDGGFSVAARVRGKDDLDSAPLDTIESERHRRNRLSTELTVRTINGECRVLRAWWGNADGLADFGSRLTAALAPHAAAMFANKAALAREPDRFPNYL